MEIFKKNPIIYKQYKSNDNFRLLEAKGNWMVFRNEVSSYFLPNTTKLKPTVELIFVEAMFIEIPTYFKGIKITKPKDKLSIQYSKKYDKGDDFLEGGERTYMIESQEERYNVVTSNLWIHNHNQQVRVSPLDFFLYTDLEKYNYYLENYVKE